MTLANVITLISFCSLSGIMIGVGLRHLCRLDRLRMQYLRQNACGLHNWKPLEGGTSLICTLCGKKSRRINPLPDTPPESISSGGILP